MTEHMVNWNSLTPQRSRDTYLFTAIFLLFIPFIQMGINFYVSVQLFLFVYLIYNLSRRDFIKNFFTYFILFFLMVVPSFLYSVDNQMHMVLNSFRIFICIAVLLAAITYKPRFSVDGIKIEKIIMGLLIVFLVLISTQFIFLKAGHNFPVPYQFLIANQNTLKGFSKAMSLGFYDQIRPSFPYGEPSYLSFIVVSLLFIVLSTIQNKKQAYIFIFLAFLIVSFSQSFSGLLSIVLLLLVYYKRRSTGKSIVFGIFLLFVLMFFLVMFRHLWFMERLLSVGMQSSSVTRLIMPFYIISYVFVHYPFGMPQDVLEMIFGKLLLGTDTGLLNVFINYGFSGFIIWGILLYKLYKVKANSLMVVYLLLASMFNGAFFTYDKVAVIGFSFILSRINFQKYNGLKMFHKNHSTPRQMTTLD